MTDSIDLAPPPVVTPAFTQRAPLQLMSDLLFALLTARDVALQHSSLGTAIPGNNLLELLSNLIDAHPEPIVRDWVKGQLRSLDQGHQIW
jgi:hypothetical protein